MTAFLGEPWHERTTTEITSSRNPHYYIKITRVLKFASIVHARIFSSNHLSSSVLRHTITVLQFRSSALYPTSTLAFIGRLVSMSLFRYTKVVQIGDKNVAIVENQTKATKKRTFGVKSLVAALVVGVVFGRFTSNYSISWNIGQIVWDIATGWIWHQFRDGWDNPQLWVWGMVHAIILGFLGRMGTGMFRRKSI